MTTPAWTSGSEYIWHGTDGDWTNLNNWYYGSVGEPATHLPDAQTNGTITIPAGSVVTIPADITTLGQPNSLSLDVKGTVIFAASTTAIALNAIKVENGGTAIIERPLSLNSNLQVNTGGTATFEGVTQDWTNPKLQASSQQGGTLNIDHSNIVMNSASIAGTLNITGGSVVSTASNSTNISGSITVTGSSFTDHSALTGTLTLNDGATATLSNNSWPTGTVVFGSGNNTLVLPDQQNAVQNVTIENLKKGDRLGVEGTDVTSATLSASNVTLVTASSSTLQPKSVTYDSSYTDAPTGDTTVPITPNDSSGQIVVCFLAGSMIATPNGAVAVENIRRGDEVLTFAADGTTHARQVVWAGTAQATVNPALPDDMAGWPVRILADAFAPGVPNQDLLVTAEHCIFANGHLVPVRMLVNGSSIFYDRTITTYSYYHVETAQHSIIMANGMLTESYLDTGNRPSFVSDGNVVTLGAKPKNWAEHAAAPLGVTCQVVRRHWDDVAWAIPRYASLFSSVCRETE